MQSQGKVKVNAKDSTALLHALREGETVLRIQDKNICFNYKDVKVCMASKCAVLKIC